MLFACNNFMLVPALNAYLLVQHRTCQSCSEAVAQSQEEFDKWKCNKCGAFICTTCRQKVNSLSVRQIVCMCLVRRSSNKGLFGTPKASGRRLQQVLPRPVGEPRKAVWKLLLPQPRTRYDQEKMRQMLSNLVLLCRLSASRLGTLAQEGMRQVCNVVVNHVAWLFSFPFFSKMCTLQFHQNSTTPKKK